MPFLINERVVIQSLKKRGTVIQCLARSRYRVQIETAMTVVCQERDLLPAAPPMKQASYPRKNQRDSLSSSQYTVDLHGMNAQEAREATLAALNAALLKDHDILIIIHGFGQGIIKEAVHAVLQAASQVKSFRLVASNPGTTEAFL
jgi:dsDNA-specific endonuclease/ATPase MutS2